MRADGKCLAATGRPARRATPHFIRARARLLRGTLCVVAPSGVALRGADLGRLGDFTGCCLTRPLLLHYKQCRTPLCGICDRLRSRISAMRKARIAAQREAAARRLADAAPT